MLLTRRHKRPKHVAIDAWLWGWNRRIRSPSAAAASMRFYNGWMVSTPKERRSGQTTKSCHFTTSIDPTIMAMPCVTAGFNRVFSNVALSLSYQLRYAPYLLLKDTLHRSILCARCQVRITFTNAPMACELTHHRKSAKSCKISSCRDGFATNTALRQRNSFNREV